MFTWGPRGSSSGGDPYFAQVMLLLHGDGANGGTTFTDSSAYARSVTIYAGTPTTSTAQSKFGGASIYGGTGSPELQFNCGAEATTSQEWTVECFINRQAGGNYHGLLWTNNANLIFLLKTPANSGTYELMLTVSGLTFCSGTTPLSIGTWYHAAATRRDIGGGSYKTSLWLDGVEEGSVTGVGTAGGPAIDLAAATNFIGRADGAGFAGFDDYIDEYRVTIGVARYTATFTPPTAAFPNS